MQIRPIGNSVSFQAVNKKYFEWAKKDYSLTKNVSSDWLRRISYDVFLFKEISIRDALDTANAVKKHFKISDYGIDDLIKRLSQNL